MQTHRADILILGGGGAGLRAAIAAASAPGAPSVHMLSKVLPMRSHTVAAEGGSAGVVSDDDTLDAHFRDTVSGGDWLCDQSVVAHFVAHATDELIQLDRWGCPWSREPDGRAAVRRFGGMGTARTWFAADKTGFHILHTLFQTSLKLHNLHRHDEFYASHLLVADGRCQGVVAIELRTGEVHTILAGATVLATGGAGRLYRFNTNGGIVTGDGMALAWRAGVALRDMEFVQYHPTGLPGSGVLITEGCRGEGGVLRNREGHRYLADYGLGPETPLNAPQNRTMELGPRDKLSQAFWHEQRKGNTIPTPGGEAVHLDLRHLGRARLHERLPLICELAKTYVGVDPADAPIPVRPAMHYTMGGVRTDVHGATSLPGLFAAGECASVGLHGANRLGSNSLSELLVYGRGAGESAAAFATEHPADPNAVLDQATQRAHAITAQRGRKGSHRVAEVHEALARTMDESFGIYREGPAMQQGVTKLRELREAASDLHLQDPSLPFNQELVRALELRCELDVALAIATAAAARDESRGAHQRLDGFTQRDDASFLQHSLIQRSPGGDPTLSYEPVNITTYPPAARVYGKPEATS